MTDQLTDDERRRLAEGVMGWTLERNRYLNRPGGDYVNLTTPDGKFTLCADEWRPDLDAYHTEMVMEAMKEKRGRYISVETPLPGDSQWRCYIAPHDDVLRCIWRDAPTWRLAVCRAALAAIWEGARSELDRLSQAALDEELLKLGGFRDDD